MAAKKPTSAQDDERPADLMFWFSDGFPCPYRARVEADTRVSLGRTDSKRGLGFVVSRGDARIEFVLDRDQVEELTAFLQMQVGRLLRPLGPKPPQMNLASMLRAQRPAGIGSPKPSSPTAKRRVGRSQGPPRGNAKR